MMTYSFMIDKLELISQVSGLISHRRKNNVTPYHYDLYQENIVKCRRIIKNFLSVLAYPVSNSNFVILIPQTLAHSHSFRAYIEKNDMQLIIPYAIHEDQIQSCISFTLAVKLSPSWNKMGRYLIHGRNFLESTKRMEAVEMGVTIDSGNERIRIDAEALTIKQNCLKMEDFNIDYNALENYYKSDSCYITEEYIYNKWCHVLPSMRKGQAVAIYHRPPEDDMFSDYAHFRTYWEKMYGYELPTSEKGIFYIEIYFKSMEGKTYVYPSCCIRTRQNMVMRHQRPAHQSSHDTAGAIICQDIKYALKDLISGNGASVRDNCHQSTAANGYDIYRAGEVEGMTRMARAFVVEELGNQNSDSGECDDTDSISAKLSQKMRSAQLYQTPRNRSSNHVIGIDHSPHPCDNSDFVNLLDKRIKLEGQDSSTTPSAPYFLATAPTDNCEFPTHNGKILYRKENLLDTKTGCVVDPDVEKIIPVFQGTKRNDRNLQVSGDVSRSVGPDVKTKIIPNFNVNCKRPIMGTKLRQSTLSPFVTSSNGPNATNDVIKGERSDGSQIKATKDAVRIDTNNRIIPSFGAVSIPKKTISAKKDLMIKNTTNPKSMKKHVTKIGIANEKKVKNGNLGMGGKDKFENKDKIEMIKTSLENVKVPENPGMPSKNYKYGDGVVLEILKNITRDVTKKCPTHKNVMRDSSNNQQKLDRTMTTKTDTTFKNVTNFTTSGYDTMILGTTSFSSQNSAVSTLNTSTLGTQKEPLECVVKDRKYEMLGKYNLNDLKNWLKNKGFKGFSKMKKPELIQQIIKTEGN